MFYLVYCVKVFPFEKRVFKVQLKTYTNQTPN